MRTPESKAAALEARRRYYATKAKAGTPQVFVVRLAVDRRFGWEIRRFGTVMSRSAETFATLILAKTAGETALANMPAEAEGAPS